MSVFTGHLKKLLHGEALTRREARAVLSAIADGEGTPAQLAAFLSALKLRGETYEELLGFAEVMRARLIPVKISRLPLVDTCGTGGDGLGTFNISTTAAFVAAGAGAAVAKHGNRGVSSKSGSADVLEALGVKTDLSARQAALCVEKAGIGFLFAPAYHPALKPLGPVRKELGVRTIFNALGPLCNPALPRHQVMGVYSDELLEPAAKVLGELGAKRALVVRSLDGLDEFSIGAPTLVVEWNGKRLKKYRVDARGLGIKRASTRLLAGGDPRRNAAIALEVLSGKKGPKLDVVLLNAGAALYAAGLARDLKEGIAQARASVATGRALYALDHLRKLSHG